MNKRRTVRRGELVILSSETALSRVAFGSKNDKGFGDRKQWDKIKFIVSESFSKGLV